LGDVGFDKNNPVHRETLRLIILSSVAEDIQKADDLLVYTDPQTLSPHIRRDNNMRDISTCKFYLLVIFAAIAAFKSRKLLWGSGSLLLSLVRRMACRAMEALGSVRQRLKPSGANRAPTVNRATANALGVAEVMRTVRKGEAKAQSMTLPMNSTCPANRRPLPDGTCENGKYLRRNRQGFPCCYLREAEIRARGRNAD
jgi:hypothetical protein